MKKRALLAFRSCMILTMMALAPAATKACVDYHPTPPPITVRIDDAWTQFEITVHQLNIFAGSPGHFCTCALVDYQDFFAFITYVAFVDSGTTDPVNGFAVWNANSTAANAWQGATGINDWSAFVAEVIVDMVPNHPVELIIRADLPPGVLTITEVDTILNHSGFGTDEWNNAASVLANTHNSVSGFGTRTFIMVPQSYFTSVNEADADKGVQVFPNPAGQVATLRTVKAMKKARVTVTNGQGQVVMVMNDVEGNVVRLLRNDLPSGIYFIRITEENMLVATSKLVLAD